MKYEESPVLELKERINVDFKKEIIAFARPCLKNGKTPSL